MSDSGKKLGFYFVRASSISKHLYCTCCKHLFNDPMRVDCGCVLITASHTFCAECIQSWLAHLPPTRPQCPLCSKKIRKATIGRDQIAYNVIGEIEVYCSNTELGCLWKGHVAELEQHLKECVYGPGNLPQWLMYSEQGKDSIGKKVVNKHKPSALTLELLKDKETKGMVVWDFLEQSKDVKEDNKGDAEWKEIEEYLLMFSNSFDDGVREIAS
eukprot:TRINITY_DN14789_c0_g1_i2.p1 TRINITY_DN14789_c0_g1~~TRINITY_DN14789_c0_g1_i2.p1  ORF type:complete len:214 (+),score=43.76 TRINITY_DN14789_c0_g1_i2:86-727(+)